MSLSRFLYYFLENIKKLSRQLNNYIKRQLRQLRELKWLKKLIKEKINCFFFYFQQIIFYKSLKQ